ncbi:hypothetical protein [Photobacterium swingsii]|uniref:hypothetical protein n=1 Tax=Photobacterium swingsii TaxID=680026 RepID=UPI004069117B
MMDITNIKRKGIPKRYDYLLLIISLLLANTSYADMSNVSGYVSMTYSSNYVDTNDHRSIRNLNWSSNLNYTFSDNNIYVDSGGYRVYEDDVGTYLTDTIIGIRNNQYYQWEETGNIGYAIQFTLPTSEFSKKDKLYTALRLSIPITNKWGNINYFFTPRVKKNFHEYKTAGDKNLTEWVASINTGIGYQWHDFTAKLSLLGGTAWSYHGTRRDWNYSGALSGIWQITPHFYTALSTSNSGVYFDAERGTVGNIDIFDLNTANYSIAVGYSF